MPDSPAVPLAATFRSFAPDDRLVLLEAVTIALDVSGRRGPQSVASRPEHLRRLRDELRASLSG